MDTSKAHSTSKSHKSAGGFGISNFNNRKQFSSLILFLSVIIVVNLCPFQSDIDYLQQLQQRNHDHQQQHQQQCTSNDVSKYLSKTQSSWDSSMSYLGQVDRCLKFVKLMFTNPMRLSKRSTRFIMAEAKVLGKMAKMWYIKKKIKKLSKKLKKHTIAVPVFTAIPIYEHSYYPQPHVTHVTHAGMHHAAASSYSPAVSPVTAASSANPQAAAAAAAAAAQQMVTSASNNHQQMAAYRMPGPHYPHHHHPYHPVQAGSHQIINSYAPSPPLYVDEAGGLYGHYGNAYSRYDGGYHLW